MKKYKEDDELDPSEMGHGSVQEDMIKDMTEESMGKRDRSPLDPDKVPKRSHSKGMEGCPYCGQIDSMRENTDGGYTCERCGQVIDTYHVPSANQRNLRLA